MKATYTPANQGDPNPAFDGHLLDKHRLFGLSYGVKILHKSTFKEVLECRCFMPKRNKYVCALWVRVRDHEASATGSDTDPLYEADSDAFRDAAAKCGFAFSRDEWDSYSNHNAIVAGCEAIVEALGFDESEVHLIRIYPG